MRLLCSLQSVGKTTSHLIYGRHQPLLPCILLSPSIPHCTARSIALKCILIRMITFSSVALQRVYSLLPCIQNPSQFNLNLPLLPSTTTPCSTPWSSQIGSLFVPCTFLLLSLLMPFRLLAVPHPPICAF